MDSKTRFTTFGIGALVGVLVLWGLNQKADPARERRRQVMASLSLPGMYYDHAVQGIPLFGHFVLAERRAKRADGGIRRELVTGGRNRFDAEGRPLPNDLLLVTEDYAPGTEPAESAKVAAIAFAFADRAELPAAAVPSEWKAGGRLEVAEDAARPAVRKVRWLGVADAKGDGLFALVDAARAAGGVMAIDWQAEAERIRKESGQ